MKLDQILKRLYYRISDNSSVVPFRRKFDLIMRIHCSDLYFLTIETAATKADKIAFCVTIIRLSIAAKT